MDLTPSERITPGSRSYVYLLHAAEVGLYKIGHSKNPRARAMALECGGPIPLRLVHQILTNDAVWLEMMLQKQYAAKRVRGEWFRLEDADVSNIRSVRTYFGRQRSFYR